MTNQTLASWSSDLINHSYDYQIELDPLGPITVMYSTYKDFWNKLSIKMSLSAYLDNVIKLLIVGKSTSPQLACASWEWDGGGCGPTWGGEGGEGLRVFVAWLRCYLQSCPRSTMNQQWSERDISPRRLASQWHSTHLPLCCHVVYNDSFSVFPLF